MKCTLSILTLITWTAFLAGQNLVPNPSFEQHDTCPQDPSKIHYAIPWFQPTVATPDYFNICFDLSNPYTSYLDVPDNTFGYQYPNSGSAYAGFFVYKDMITPYFYREYIEVRLLDSLQAGVEYYISFYVSLADSSTYATSDIGLCFSQDSLIDNDYDTLTCPFFSIGNQHGNSLTDKNNWMLIKTTYIANGDEKYIIIGNFKDDFSTDTVPVPGGGTSIIGGHDNFSYYYIDDVCISSDHLACGITGIHQNQNQQFISVYPNPTNQQATLEFNNSKKENYTLAIFDCHGLLVRIITGITSGRVEIPKQNLTSGMYFFQLRTNVEVYANGKLAIE